jgi:hypothetical protein
VRATLGLAAVIAIVSGTAAADTDAALDQLMGHLAQRHHGHASFVERQFIAVLDRPTEASGELFYDAPDRLEKRTLKPKPESLILDRGTLDLRRGKTARTLNLRDYPQIGIFVDSIRETLAGDLAALKQVYSVEFTAAANGWVLVLIPRDPQLVIQVSRIRVSGQNDDLRVIEFERPNGDHSVMTISPLPSD